MQKKTKKTPVRLKKVKDEPKETPVVETPKKQEVETPKQEVVVEESEARKSFRAYMAGYKVKNPVKYARKEQELLKQLEQIP